MDAASAMAANLKQLITVVEAALLPEEAPDLQARRSGLHHAAVEARYQLDDALDSYNAMVACRREAEEAPRSILHRFRSSSPAATEGEFRKVEATIEKLHKETNQMLQECNQLGLQLTDSERQGQISNFLSWNPIQKYDIAGKIAEQEMEVISTLTDNQSSDHVILIVGPDESGSGWGGSGKTTLARKVLDNHHIRHAFSTVLWVQSYKHFSDEELLSAIASAAGFKQTSRGPKSAKKVEEMLASVLEGKRFLLVLDDVWSHQVRENFLQALPVQHGSRILMTTRDKSVAYKMRSRPDNTHKVNEWHSQCWELLCHSACLDARQCDDKALRVIGIEISQKCRKIPLAIQLIGGLLRTKDTTSHDEWRNVRDHKGWSSRSTIVPVGMEGVAGAIQVAYCDLPPHLKRCFRYCVHLPEGFLISKQMITQLWISEGFVEEQDGCSLQDTAEDYYTELVLRKLVQAPENVSPPEGGHNTERCTLNACVRSVLQLYTRDSMPTTTSSSTPPGQERITSACFRTVILCKNSSGERVLHQVSKNARYLRSLDLTGAGIRYIPGPLEPLLHLRFLNLSHTDITELPESIANLRNLQFLLLRFCCRLHSLPGGISKLHDLRTLDLQGTEPHLVLPSLAGLKQLTTLHGFQVKPEGEQMSTSGWPLQDLQHLNSLRSLQIVKVERIQKHVSSQGADLPMKHRLTHLVLRGSSSTSAARGKQAHAVAEEDDALGSLKPPQCLESLKIESYHGRSLPSWVLQLPRLQRLVVNDCRRCASLPADLGQLPQLKVLALSGCSELHAIKSRAPRAFPTLAQLHLDDMPSLESWDGFEDGDLPSLEELRLQGCPSMGSLPSCLRRSELLTRMVVVSAGSLEAIDGLAALRDLVVQDCERLESISNLPKLEALSVAGCSGLRDATGLDCLKHLRFLHRELTRLPDWLLEAVAAAETLAVVGREELLKSLVPGGEDWPVISDICKVYGNLLNDKPIFTYDKSTGVVQSFGERRSTAASLQPKSWRSALTDFAGRIGMMTPARKCACAALLVIAASQVFLKLPTLCLGPVPVPMLVFFFLATACFLYFFSQLQ